jgi:predicted transcriptional regulator
MEEAWHLDVATVRTVMEALNRRAAKPRAYTTYMTVMARLERKGFLVSRRHGKANVYTTAVDRTLYVRQHAEAEVAALVERYGDAALVQIAKRIAALDPVERDRFSRLGHGLGHPRGTPGLEGNEAP